MWAAPFNLYLRNNIKDIVFLYVKNVLISLIVPAVQICK